MKMKTIVLTIILFFPLACFGQVRSEMRGGVTGGGQIRENTVIVNGQQIPQQFIPRPGMTPEIPYAVQILIEGIRAEGVYQYADVTNNGCREYNCSIVPHYMVSGAGQYSINFYEMTDISNYLSGLNDEEPCTAEEMLDLNTSLGFYLDFEQGDNLKPGQIVVLCRNQDFPRSGSE